MFNYIVHHEDETHMKRMNGNGPLVSVITIEVADYGKQRLYKTNLASAIRKALRKIDQLAIGKVGVKYQTKCKYPTR